jgi:hypothetical protein
LIIAILPSISAKIEKLKNVINNLAAQKDSAIEKTDEKLEEILRQEKADI